MKTGILLADDHEVVRDGLRALLDKQPDFEVIAVAGDGLETVKVAHQTNVDVIIMDINMPNMSGIEATRQIKEQLPGVKVLTLSVHSRGSLISEIIEAGASGYLPKTSAGDELVGAIRTVMQGHTYISPKVMDSVVDYMRTDKQNPVAASTALNPRERQVLCLVANGKTTKEISDCLNLSGRTIEFHRQKIMEKLDIHSIAELTKYAIQEGLTPLDSGESP